ncbi:MAG: sulfurtransferase [Paracoccaceae bacterium]
MTRTTLALGATLGLLAGPAAAAPLATPGETRAAVEDGAVLLDIRGAEAFAEGHAPGAVNVPYAAFRGPEESPGRLISDAELTDALRRAGIEPGERVIVANAGEDPSDFGGMARVYWTLKSAGLEDISVLNGGLAAWRDAGLPTTTEAVPVERSDATFTLSDRWAATREEGRAVAEGEGDALLIDARPDAFFRGETKHDAATWAGTLRGAANVVYSRFFGGDAVLRADAEAVREVAREAGWTPGRTVVSFCNTGHWAASNWFALSEVGGIEDVKLYPESMVGYSAAYTN